MPQQNNYLLTREGKWVTVSDDELYHWKYIKREKVNGKWRYYYHDDNVKKTRDNLERATKSYDRAKAAYEDDKKHNDALQEAISKQIYEPTMSADEFGILAKARHQAIDAEIESKNEFRDKEYKYRAAKNAANKALAAYEKSAGHKVADLLNKSSDKIDKAKSWVSNLFKKKKKSK